MIDLKKNIRTFIVENFLFGEADGLADDTSFLDQAVIDSTGVLELVAHLESAYGIKVKDEEILPDNFDSINAIATYLVKKRAA